MSRDRASSISVINSKYAGLTKNSNLYHQQPVQVANVVYNPVGKTEEVQAVKESVTTSKIPKWLWFLLGALILASIAGAIYYFWNQAQNKSIVLQPIQGKVFHQRNGRIRCEGSFFQNQGKCILCPASSTWSGKQCVAQKETQLSTSQVKHLLHLYDAFQPLTSLKQHQKRFSHYSHKHMLVHHPTH